MNDVDDLSEFAIGNQKHTAQPVCSDFRTNDFYEPVLLSESNASV